MSIKGLAGMRGREPAVDTEAALPGLRGATRADNGMSSESLLEESEPLSFFTNLDGRGFSEAKKILLGMKGRQEAKYLPDAIGVFAAAKIDARRAAAFGVRALVEADALARTAVMLSGCRNCTLSDFDHLGRSGRSS